MCTESNFKPSAQLNTCRSAEFHCKLSADLLPQACRVTASVSVSELIILVMLCERVGLFDEAAVDVMRVKQWQNCLSSSTRSDKSWRRGSIQYEKLAGLFIYTVNLSVYSLLPSSCRWIFELKVNTNLLPCSLRFSASSSLSRRSEKCPRFPHKQQGGSCLGYECCKYSTTIQSFSLWENETVINRLCCMNHFWVFS